MDNNSDYELLGRLVTMHSLHFAALSSVAVHYARGIKYFKGWYEVDDVKDDMTLADGRTDGGQ